MRGFVLLACLTLLAGCGPRAVDVAGIWQGTWAPTEGRSVGRFSVEVRQRGKTIEGEIELSVDWLPKSRIVGIVEGRRIRWGVLRGGAVVLTFEGQIDGEVARGTYTIGTTTRGGWTAQRVRR
ncbi:MAG: hypothetical protein ACT4P5_01855 [Armatimonadota bacterium]